MKTKIFTSAAMFILTTNLIAGTADMNKKDSTKILAYASVDNTLSEIGAGNNAPAPELNITSTANILEEWVADRESWEQEGSDVETGNTLTEAVNFEEWISERESWEQGSEPTKTEITEMISMEEWIASRDSWEQEGSKTRISYISVDSDILETWISDRDSWEQK